MNQEQQPGNYEAAFDASNLPSGVYIYRLQSGGKNLSKKMILLK
ncbi:MAG: T9SS type A sorting domain-containing protein [Ignavibacteriaceae bacterium]